MFTQGYTFDDVLLIPKHSNVRSRSNVDLSVNLPRGIKLDIPIVSANMKNVTDVEMTKALAKLGGMPVLHRFDDYSNIIKKFESIKKCLDDNVCQRVAASVGINKEKDIYLAQGLYDAGCKIICVDVAHGDHGSVSDFVSNLRYKISDAVIIAGNVATESGANLLWEAGADIIKSGIGSGCFASGTRILMSNGFYKNIEDIKPGDRVINMYGNPNIVLNAFSTGVKKVAKIRNSINYYDTYVTPDHKYYIGDLSSVLTKTLRSKGYAKTLSKQSKTKPKVSKLKWQSIGDSEDIALLMPSNIKFELNNSFEIPIEIRSYTDNGRGDYDKKVDFVLEPSYELGYIFGTFLGDGHACLANNGKTDTAQSQWYFGLEESEYAEKLQGCIKKVTGRAITIKPTKNILLCSLYHKPFSEFLATFGKRTNKHLPENLLVNNTQYLQGISDGLVATDGHKVVIGRTIFDNTPIRLIELFNVVTYLLTGVFPNNQKKKIITGNLKNANIDNFNQPYTSRINTTAEKRLLNDYQISKLLEYEETELEVEVYDLTIDDESHSFIANNAIVHNSLCTTRIETGNGYPQLSALQNICNGDYKERNGNWPMFIADGGIKVAGDCVKSLVFADLAMLGSILAGTNEAPGTIVSMNGIAYKEYAGSSTHKSKHIEGVVGLVPCKGPVEDVITKFTDGIKSGCSYQGVNNLVDLKKDPQFVVISNAGLVESRPHSVHLR